MKRAHKHREYRDVSDFEVPEGVVTAQIDPESGDLATSACPTVVTDYYLVGTQPVQFCPLHQGGSTEIAGWDTTSPGQTQTTIPNVPVPSTTLPPSGATPGSQPPKQEPEKKSMFDKLKGLFHKNQ
jgi:penicillin-binding protein 1B